MEALSKPQVYQDDIGPPDKVGCLATIFFSSKKKVC